MLSVLLIEDEPHMRRSVKTLLRHEGYDVLEAPNGRLGIDLARDHRPDIILCDITMPDMDGFTVLSLVRNTPSMNTVPFIFLTARGDPRDVRQGMNMGADDYLPKPFSPADLLSAIESRINRVRGVKECALPVFESAAPLERLGVTPSEAEVLLWMAQGKSNAEIAAILDVGIATVKKHAVHIFDKLGVDNRAAAMLMAREALTADGFTQR